MNQEPIENYQPKDGALLQHIQHHIPQENPSQEDSFRSLKQRLYNAHPQLYEVASPVAKGSLKLLKSCQELLVIKGKDLIGDGVITKPAKLRAKRVARTATASNVANALPLPPALALMLSSLGVVSAPASVGLALGLCVVQNFLVAKLVEEFAKPKIFHSKKKMRAKFLGSPTALALLGINVSLSLLSFPLGIYLSSKGPLSEGYAQQKVFPQIERENQRVIELKESEINLVEREADCEKGLAKIVELGSKPNSTQDNGRNRMIVDHMGKNTKRPFSPYSICGKAIRDREALNKLEAKIQAPLVAAKQAAATRALPAVGQLREFFPEKYKSLYTDEGLIKSPSTALSFSLEYSAIALRQGESGALLFPLVMLCVSVALSYAAIAMTIALAEDSDVRMSFDSESAHLLSAALHKEQETLRNAQK